MFARVGRAAERPSAQSARRRHFTGTSSGRIRSETRDYDAARLATTRWRLRHCVRVHRRRPRHRGGFHDRLALGVMEAGAKRAFPWGRLWDVAALLVVAFVLWKIFVAPRSFRPAESAQPAPQASFTRLDGSAFRVTDARGHLLFLDFYASWCEPCKVEIPMVESWAKTHRGAVVVPVDVAEPPIAV